MSKIINLGTTLALLDLGEVGINHPPALPVVVPEIHKKRVTHLKSSDYHNVMNRPKPPKSYEAMSVGDLAKLEAAEQKRLRKLQRRTAQ